MYENYKNTKCFSDETIKDHLKLLDGYTKNAAKLSKKLKTLDRDDVNTSNSPYRITVESLRFNYNAQLLHQLYFSQINHETTTASDRKEFKDWLEASLPNTATKAFKTFDQWKADLFAAAKASRGWVVFGYEPFQRVFMNAIVDSHDVGLSAGFFPILVLDMWEHAYVGDFGTNKQKYVTEWFNHINWEALKPAIITTESLDGTVAKQDLLKTLTASVYYKLDQLKLLEE